MANNLQVKDAAGATQVLKTTDNGGVHTPHHLVDSLPADPFGVNADAAITSDAAGSISGKLRGLVKWAFERMPAALGRRTAAQSLGVALSSDAPIPSVLSTNNSSTTPLGAGATFTGTADEVKDNRSVTVNLYASHASAASGLSLQFSSDGSNWDHTFAFTVPAATGRQYVVPALARYFRVVYTNGGTIQTAFRLQTIIHPTSAGTPTVYPADQAATPMSFGALAAGSNLIGKVQVRNAADSGTIDPLPEATFTGRLGEVQDLPAQYTLLRRLRDLLTGISLAASANRVGKVTVRNAADAADIDPLADATFTGRIGEVQASPTANTVLARLKDLLTGIVLAAGTNVIGKVRVRNSADTADIDPVKEDTFTGRLGEVQAIPTAYTLLGRLKDIKDGTVLAAGEQHIGEVGQRVVIVSVTPTVSSSPAYSAGDLIGGKLAFASAARANGGGGEILSVTVTDKNAQSANVDLLLFDSDPSNTTFTDNAAFALADADLGKSLGVIPLTSHSAFADNSVSSKDAVGKGFMLASGTTLYGALVARSTPTFASTADITVRLAIRLA